MPQYIHVYDYVNHGCGQVRDALLHDPKALFERATHAGAARAGDLGAELHVKIAGLEVGAAVEIEIVSLTEAALYNRPATRIDLAWRAVNHAGWFPTMKASLSIYALTPTETQLDFEGRYDPPLGIVGAAIDATVMHRLARAAVTGFIQEVADYLRRRVPVAAAS